jgi:hypothetical protein
MTINDTLAERGGAAVAHNGHEWHERFNLTCCRKCGLVRRADGTSSPCKGIVRVAFRSPTSHNQTAPDEHAGTGEQG